MLVGQQSWRPPQDKGIVVPLPWDCIVAALMLGIWLRLGPKTDLRGGGKSRTECCYSRSCSHLGPQSGSRPQGSTHRRVLKLSPAIFLLYKTISMLMKSGIQRSSMLWKSGIQISFITISQYMVLSLKIDPHPHRSVNFSQTSQRPTKSLLLNAQSHIKFLWSSLSFPLLGVLCGSAFSGFAPFLLVIHNQSHCTIFF